MHKKKIDAWSKGWAGSCGTMRDHILFLEWLENRDDLDYEPPRLKKSFGALFTEDNKVYLINRDLVAEEASIPIGIGSAGPDCEVLCRVGYSASDAIKTAMKWRKDIDGDVQVVKL